MSSPFIIGEVTEAIHRTLLDGYDLKERVPRIEEDLEFEPKDREEVIYLYMYRLVHNENLKNPKRLRQAPLQVGGPPEDGGRLFYHRPPLLMDLFYVICAHAKFRSDAERLLGWVLLTLNYTPRLVYRPRRFALPENEGYVDSQGEVWDPARRAEGLLMEKVSLALVDDMTLGDAVNLFTILDAPYRPFLTFRARVALDGPLVEAHGGTQISMPRAESFDPRAENPSRETPSGRIRSGQPTSESSRTPPGPKAYHRRRLQMPESAPED